MTQNTQLCPCNSQVQYADCCAPFISGKKSPKTAEELLRARYTAFTMGEVDYVLGTHHSKTVGEVKREEIEDWSKSSEWLGLKVVQVEAGKAEDDKATIVFCASYNDANGKKQDHWEQSFFEKENGQWKFLDARGITGTYRRQEPKVGRNDPCACGSGKKSKKCCAV